MEQSRFASEQNVELHLTETRREMFTKSAVTHLLTSSWPWHVCLFRAKFCFLLFTSDLCWVSRLHISGVSYQNTFRCCTGRQENLIHCNNQGPFNPRAFNMVRSVIWSVTQLNNTHHRSRDCTPLSCYRLGQIPRKPAILDFWRQTRNLKRQFS